MNLRRKTLLSMSAVMAVMIAALAILSYAFVLEAALEQEQHDVETDLERVNASLQVIETEMSRTTTDWAVWNDTYIFMNDRNQVYIDSYLGYNVCNNLGLNCILLFNSSNELLYGTGYDYNGDMPWDPSDRLISSILVNVDHLDIDEPDDSAQGLMMTEEGILMISVHPVTDNDLTVTNGFLVMGRYIGDETAMDISDTLKLEATLLTTNERSRTGLDEDSWNSIVANGSIVSVVSDQNAISGYRALVGIDGSSVGVIKIETGRDTFAQASSSMTIIHGTLVFISLVFCAVTILLTDHFTTKRLGRLSRQVKEIGKDGDMSRRVEMDGSDELTHLAAELNRAMETIETISKTLSESEKRYQTIVNDQTELIFRMDENGRIKFANDALIRLVDLDPKKITGMNLSEIATPAQYEDIMEKCASALATGGAVTTDQRYRKHAEGGIRWMSWTIRCIPSGGGAADYQCVGRDLTEQKEAETALALANKKLNLLASITRHDVINKLTVAHGFVTITRKKTADPRCDDYLAKAEEALETIEGYLEFTRNYQGMGMAAPVWINLEQAIGQAAEGLHSEGIEVSIDVGDHEILTDPLVEKVFYNLLDNSLQHGVKVGRVKVSVQPAGGSLLITFEDDGIGIAAKEKELIFEAGYGKHTGYGLFLAREILNSSGMTIVETGEPGRGARFEIMVPPGRYRHSPSTPTPSSGPTA
jgi:PAS domain S-box-containing protein